MQSTTESIARSADHQRTGAERMAAAMADIHQSMEQMVQAIGVINEIAQQTNLLSLNAAIEAAQDCTRTASATQELAHTVQEVSRTAQDLSNMAEHLASAARRFQV